MLGVDETSFLKATPTAPTRWVSAVVDVGRRRAVDLFEGRNAADLDRWLEDQPEQWKAAVEVAVADLHEPFRAALSRAPGPRPPGRRPLPRRRRRHPGRGHGPPPRPERDPRPPGPQGRPALPGPQAADPGRRTARPRRQATGSAACSARATPTGRSTTPGSPRNACATSTPWPPTPPSPPAGWTSSSTTSPTAPCPNCDGMARTLRRWRDHILAWHTPAPPTGRPKR